MAFVAVTVVTGGSRGIGAATARRLAAAGHDVAISYREDEAAADKVVAAVRAHGRRALAVRADVSREPDVVRLFDTVAQQFGTLTGLVNNAGVTSRLGRLKDLSTQDLRRVIDVNVVGAILCCRRAVGDMVDGGAIVNVSSAAATLGSPGEYVHYTAAKAAVDALTVGLAREVAADGIRSTRCSRE